MAIEFARAHVLSRSAGHSAVKAAAYRAGEKLEDERTGRVADYSHRSSDVLCAKVLLPEGADQAFADRKTLWDAVEVREDQHNRRASAQLAKDYIIALPCELNDVQRIALAESFARSEFVSRGLVVDMAVHAHSQGNPHAHLMTTTRQLEGSAFTEKVREVNGKFYGGAKLADAEQLRHRWADFQNAYFKENGINLSVTNHKGEYEPEKHLGAAHAMNDRGVETNLNEQVQHARTGREKAILNNPGIIIDRVSDKKAVFTRHDLYRELTKVVKSAEVFSEVKAKLDVHPSLVTMTKDAEKDYLTTIDVLNMEHSIRLTSDKLMADDANFSIGDRVKDQVMKDYAFLSDEQKEAVSHLTDSKRLGIVMGLAGAGKSTMLEAVRKINEESGHRVFGVALAGKAADELEKSSGIASSTIASFLYGVKSGRVELRAGDVLAIDEFGMVSNKQATALLRVAEKAGAKVIAVGDTEQLQSIQAGAALRDLSDRHGYAAIETIRRQHEPWQREATFKLAKGRAASAISAYRKNGHVHTFAKTDSGDNAVQAIIADYLNDTKEGSKAVLAHRRTEVKALNDGIRQGLIDAGRLDSGRSFLANTGRDEQRLVFDLEPGDEVVFNSRDVGLGLHENETGTFIGHVNGELNVVHADGRALAFTPERYHDLDIPDKKTAHTAIDLSVGDRLLFTRNDKEIGVKNGQLGDLLSYKGDTLTVRMDSGETLSFSGQEYSDIAHGYATTVHKSQGMTVDNSYVLGSETMDAHLAYVGMSRHRESMEIYTNDEARFVYAASRDNRQETALNFAEKNDLELRSDAHIETINQILAGQVVESPADQHGVKAISQEDYQRANRWLKEETSRWVVTLSEDAQQPVNELETKATQLSNEIQTLEQDEPRAGLFNKKAHAQWEHKVAVKRGEHAGVLRQIQSLSSGTAYLASQEGIQKKAALAAKKARPKEAAIVEGYKADKAIVKLNTDLVSLDKDISRARTHSDDKTLSTLLKRKSTILNSLKNRSDLTMRQGQAQKQQVAKEVMETKTELGLLAGRGLDLGR